MKFWLDAHLSPKIAVWLRSELDIGASTLKELGLRDAEDDEIFHAARDANAVIITKDVDFVNLQERLSPTICNLAYLRQYLQRFPAGDSIEAYSFNSITFREW